MVGHGINGAVSGFCSRAIRAGFDVVSLDHAIERFTIDAEYPRGRLFVAASVLQHFGNVPPLDH